MIKIQSKIKKAYFNIGNHHYYEGYHDENKKWNGWATPYFNKYIADLMVKNYSSENFSITYNSQDDCYIVISKDNGTTINESIAKKIIVDTEEGKKELYDFASLGWTWDSYNLDEVRAISNSFVIYENETIECIEIDF